VQFGFANIFANQILLNFIFDAQAPPSYHVRYTFWVMLMVLVDRNIMMINMKWLNLVLIKQVFVVTTIDVPFSVFSFHV
jgi:hypothetical protein